MEVRTIYILNQVVQFRPTVHHVPPQDPERKFIHLYNDEEEPNLFFSSQFSSKNRRKEARKKIDLREGGYYEDIALIRALHILYSNVFSLGNEVREVCIILEHNNFQLAKSLHTNLSHLQETMKKHVCLIWPDIFINVPQILDNTVLAVTENKADLGE